MEDKRLISKLYDALASSYEELYGEEQLAKFSEIVRYLPKKTFQIILDAGCGTGLFFEKLSKMGSEVIGLDLSQKMLLCARSKAARFKVHLVRGDVEHLPFRDEHFNLVVSATVLPVGPSSRQALKELLRVLRNGGLLVLTIPRKAEITEEVLNALKQLNMRIRAFHETPYIKDAVIIAER